MKKITLNTAFILIVTLHMILVIGIVTSFLVLPFKEPWYTALPLMVFIWFFSTSNVKCKLTMLENHIRKKIGKKRIGGFVGHYILKPIYAYTGIKQLQQHKDNAFPSKQNIEIGQILEDHHLNQSVH